jgi:hypothetical protein
MSREQMKARLEAATEGPWFLNDCEGELIVLPEADLIRVERGANGEIESWGLPSFYPPERRILEVELDSWDEGEDEQDDQIRANAELIAHAPTDLAKLHAALDAVEAMHRQDTYGPKYCTCGDSWPCATVTAIQSAIDA